MTSEKQKQKGKEKTLNILSNTTYIIQRPLQRCAAYVIPFLEGNFNWQCVDKTLLLNAFFSKQLFSQSTFQRFVSWYLIMLRRCGSTHLKGNFTLFNVVCIT